MVALVGILKDVVDNPGEAVEKLLFVTEKPVKVPDPTTVPQPIKLALPDTTPEDMTGMPRTKTVPVPLRVPTPVPAPHPTAVPDPLFLSVDGTYKGNTHVNSPVPVTTPQPSPEAKPVVLTHSDEIGMNPPT